MVFQTSFLVGFLIQVSWSGLFKVGFLKIGFLKFGFFKVGFPKVGFLEFGFLKVWLLGSLSSNLKSEVNKALKY